MDQLERMKLIHREKQAREPQQEERERVSESETGLPLALAVPKAKPVLPVLCSTIMSQ